MPVLGQYWLGDKEICTVKKFMKKKFKTFPEKDHEYSVAFESASSQLFVVVVNVICNSCRRYL